MKARETKVRETMDALRKYAGLPVVGYRPQTEESVRIVNVLKLHEERMLQRLDLLKQNNAIDQRWLAIGRTQLEQAFMAINRSVFKPERAALDEEVK